MLNTERVMGTALLEVFSADTAEGAVRARPTAVGRDCRSRDESECGARCCDGPLGDACPVSAAATPEPPAIATPTPTAPASSHAYGCRRVIEPPVIARPDR